MRKSTVIILVLLLVAGGGTLFLADAYFGPYKEDAGVGQRLTRLYGERGEIAPDSKMKVLRVARQEGRDGPGLNLEMSPSVAIQERHGALRALARNAAREAAEAYGMAGNSLRWFRVRVFLPGEERREAVLWRDTDGQIGDPQPPLPSTWPPEGSPPREAPGPAPAPAPVKPGG